MSTVIWFSKTVRQLPPRTRRKKPKNSEYPFVQDWPINSPINTPSVNVQNEIARRNSVQRKDSLQQKSTYLNEQSREAVVKENRRHNMNKPFDEIKRRYRQPEMSSSKNTRRPATFSKQPQSISNFGNFGNDPQKKAQTQSVKAVYQKIC
jgi:hypothetical protein